MFTEVKAKEDFAAGHETASVSHLSCKPHDCSPPGEWWLWWGWGWGWTWRWGPSPGENSKVTGHRGRRREKCKFKYLKNFSELVWNVAPLNLLKNRELQRLWNPTSDTQAKQGEAKHQKIIHYKWYLCDLITSIHIAGACRTKHCGLSQVREDSWGGFKRVS